MKPVHSIPFGLILLTVLGAIPGALAAGTGGDVSSTKPASMPTASAKDEHVKTLANREAGKRRQLLVKEAIVANDKIVDAILFLKKKDTKQAIKALEEADGKLNVILARDPNLKLAAISVRSSINDLEATTDTINKSVKEAKSALDDGQIQAARAMLSPLTSEMLIYTDFLPLELYPDAIKRASKEIQDSKLSEAEATLADTLGLIVTDEDVIPLPPMKAEGDVLEAELLLNKDKVKNKDKVLSLLNSADSHLANASALGYGKYQDIRDEIASIKAKVDANTSKPDLFERAKNLFHGIMLGKKKG